MKVTAEEIDAAKTAKGGWDRATLAAWGVGWPPPKGWRQMLIDGTPIPEPGVDGEPANSQRPSACPEAALLRQVVMAVIEHGQGEILSSIPELNAYYGFELPTVADVIGGRPEHAVITGGISFDDKVYSFRCERSRLVGQPPSPAPSKQIEVTPEMIEAGAEIIYLHFYDVIPHGSDTGRATAVDIYRAMKALELTLSKGQHDDSTHP